MINRRPEFLPYLTRDIETTVTINGSEEVYTTAGEYQDHVERCLRDGRPLEIPTFSEYCKAIDQSNELTRANGIFYTTPEDKRSKP